jgi:F-type H+-transporting ATPase subunit c
MTDVTAIAQWATLAVLGAAFGPGVVLGLVVYAALRGIARNPEAASEIQTSMVLGLAFIEAIAIYALVVALTLLFVFPGIVGVGG